MSQYHVNPATGDAGACRALKGKCPFGGPENHFTTVEAARAHYEAIQEKLPKFTGVSKGGEPLTYDFPERNLELAKKAIETANRRLEKAGVEERFSYSIEEYMATEEDRVTGLIKAEPRIKFKVNTPSVKFKGYRFLAAVEKAEAGFVVKSATGVLLGGYRPDALRCDACGKAMTRQKTYLVEDSEGKMLQVGSSCVKNYFGVEPAGLWALTYDPLVRAKDSDAWNRAGTSYDSAIPTDWVMAYALAVSEGGEKFVSRRMAEDYGNTSTADLTKTAISGNDDEYRREMQRKAQEYISNGEAKRLIEKLKNSDSTTQFGQNMVTVASGEYTRWQHMNILIGGLSEIAREKRQAAKIQHEAAWGIPRPGYMGPIGEKLAGKKLKVYSTSPQFKPSRYYPYEDEEHTRVIFRDSDNHVVIWWASKKIELPTGAEVTVKSGSIKEHNHFNGVDQTVVTRVKLEEDV